MKAPATQLYWKEWVGDMALGRCSLAAQGAWVRILAVLHQSEEYGVLRWPLAEVAAAANVPLRFARELAAKNVLKGSDALSVDFLHIPRHAGQALEPVVLVKADGGSCWFSARFVRDEWRKNKRGAGTRFTAENQPGRSPTRRVGEPQGDGPAFASAFASRSSNNTATDTLQEAAESLARALRENGYSECSEKADGIVAAARAGVSPEVLGAIAREKPGKPIAYLVATAIGRRDDANAHGSSAPAAPQPENPAEVSRRVELRQLEDQLIDLRHLRDHLQSITPDEYTARALPLEAAMRELAGRALA